MTFSNESLVLPRREKREKSMICDQGLRGQLHMSPIGRVTCIYSCIYFVISCNFRFPEIELANECSIPVFRSSHGINHGDSVNFLILSTFYFVVFAGVKAAIYLCLRIFLVLVRSFSYVIGHQATVQSSSASTAKDLAHHERLRFITESFRGGNKRESFRVF